VTVVGEKTKTLNANDRNGATAKAVLAEDGPARIDVPRDRQGSFESLLIRKHERRFAGFDDKIISMYVHGMTVRDIQGFLAEQDVAEVSPDFIGSVADELIAELTAWQSRPREPMYPVMLFDVLQVNLREEAVVRSNAIYLALGVLPAGMRVCASETGAPWLTSRNALAAGARFPPL
jgi:putative transposase